MSETMKMIRMWHNIFQVVKEKYFQPRNLYPAKISFKNKIETKKYSDEEKLRKFVARRSIFK